MNFESNEKWTKEKYIKFQKYLYTNIDEEYKKFNDKIITTEYKMLGIRVPLLRNIAKSLKKTDIISYLDIVTPKTYEEIFIYGIVISYIKDYNFFLKYFRKFLPFIDNWAICDMTTSSYKIINKNKDLFLEEIKKLLYSNKEYYVRVGVVSLMDYYIENKYLTTIFKLIDNIKVKEYYYVHMAISWLISVMYVKNPKETEVYLKNNKLDIKTQNKAIQKIRESYRVTKEQKEYLLKYKRKEL